MESKIPVSVIILCKNEELAIEACIASVQEFAQVLVVDSKSTDRTVYLSEKAGAQVITFDWDGKYPKKKQWSIERVEVLHDWVLLLDADERVTTELASEIRDVFASEDLKYFDIGEFSLEYYFLQKKLKHGHNVRKKSLMNKRTSRFPELSDLGVSNMWEVEGHYQPLSEKKCFTFHHKIKHDDPDGLFDYFARHNRYSDWESHLSTNKALALQVSDLRTNQGKFFQKFPFKPLVFFLYCFFLRLGFLDGKSGFHYAIAQSFYYWQIGVKVKELRNNAKIE